jgi:hypothetical protein
VLRFYLGLLRDIPRHFREAFETWQFWVGTVILLASAALALAGPQIGDHFNIGAIPRWIGYGGFGLLVVWALLRANYNRFEALEKALQDAKGDMARLIDSYAFGLASDGLYIAMEDSDTSAFQISLKFRNAAPGPLKYQIGRVRVVLGGHEVANPQYRNMEGIIPKDGQDMFHTAAFPRRTINEIGSRFVGWIEYEAKYGPAGGAYSHVVKRKHDVSIRIVVGTGGATVSFHLTTSQTDEAIRTDAVVATPATEG